MLPGFATLMEVPVPIAPPLPQPPAYQVSVPLAPAVAVRLMLPLSPAQMAEGDALGLEGATGSALTVTVTLAQVELPQDAVSHRQ